MAEQIIISNDKLKVTISTRGAEVLSVVDNKDCQFIWPGSAPFWGGHSPVLFPICGGLKDDKFVFEGKEYNLQKHGYGRFKEFEVEKVTENSATFLHCSDDETKINFPFDYEFRIIYTIIDNCLNIEYNVKNNSSGDMFYSVGGHEGFYCPGGIENYYIVFEKEEDLDSNILNGSLIEHETLNFGKNTTVLPLKYEYFAVDAQVFTSLKSRKVTLKNNKNDRTIELNFDGNDTFVLWSQPGAEFVCIEAWAGVHDFVDSNYDITAKKGIVKVPQNNVSSIKHSIIFK